MFGEKLPSIKITCPTCDKSTSLTQVQNYSIDDNNTNDVFNLKHTDDLVYPKMEKAMYDICKKISNDPTGVFANISIMEKHRAGGLLSESCVLSEKYFKVFWHYFIDENTKTAGISFRLIEEMLPATKFTDYGKIFFVSRNDELDKEIQELKSLGKHPEIIAITNRELSIISDNNLALFEKGEALFALGNYEDALSCYDKILESQPDHDSSLIGKGVALRNLGKFEEAISCYDKILESSPNYANALSSKGVALRYLDRLDEAMACYDQSLKIEPEGFKIWINKGTLFYVTGNFVEAISCYDKALKIEPNHESLQQLKEQALKELNKN